MTPRPIRTGAVQSTVALVDILGTRTVARTKHSLTSVSKHDRVGTRIMGKDADAFFWALQECVDSSSGHDESRDRQVDPDGQEILNDGREGTAPKGRIRREGVEQPREHHCRQRRRGARGEDRYTH